MPGLDELTADQRAVLQLLLGRGKNYDDIARVLKSDEATVRDRAHKALQQLAETEASDELSDADRSLLCDHVLGQGDAAGAEALLDRSSAARAWLRAVRAPLTASGLQTSAAPPGQQYERAAAAGAADDGDGPSASRAGGAVLLGLLAAGIISAVLWAAGVFDGGSPEPTKTVATSGPTSGTKILRQINMLPPSGAGSAKGVAFVAEQDGKQAIGLNAQGLAPGSFYALWIQRGGKWRRVGFLPQVRAEGEQRGRIALVTENPVKDILSYDRMVVSRERSSDPKTPKQVVLQGSLGRG